MDQETKQQPKRSPLVLVLIIIIVVLAAAAVVLVVGKFGEKPEEAVIGDAQTPLIGYEEGVTVVDDPDALQKAVDEMYAKAAEGGIPLEYQATATSKDGEKVDCYIANPEHNICDMYFQIFADDAYTDQLYLSGLIPPGKAVREMMLDHRLDAGKRTVNVVFTRVETKDGKQTIRDQAIVTMEIDVVE